MRAPRPVDLGRLQQHRDATVRAFLWILLGILGATLVVNAFLLGPRILAPSAIVPNASFAAILLAALYFAHREKCRAAVGLVVTVILFAASLPLFAVGIDGREIGLFLLFVPLVLAGLLLDRRALYLTAGWTLVVVLSAPALDGAGLLLGEPLEDGAGWPVAIQFALIFATVTLFLDRFGLTYQGMLRAAVEREAAYREEVTERLRTRDELAEEKRFNEAILESLPGIFFVLDESGSYFRWNRNFMRALGYDEVDLDTLHPLDLFEGGERDLIAEKIAQVFTDGNASVEATVKSKNGERIPYFLNGTRVTLGGSTFLAGVGIDRSDIDAAQARIHELNDELHERLEHITALREVDQAISGNLDLDATLDVVLTQVTQRLNVDAASVLLFRAETDALHLAAAKGLEISQLLRGELALEESLALQTARRRERFTANEGDGFTGELARLPQIEGGHRVQTFVATPLIVKDEFLGVLELFHSSPLSSGDEWVEFLDAMAAQVAVALENARMFDQLEGSNEKLQHAYDATIEGWSRALDLRDEETEGHSQRVTELTVRLAEQLGMTQEEITHARRGALLHDIGKMGVPDAILLKPGKLDPDERATMEKHTTYAYDLLSPIEFLQPALAIPYCHHERWDGSGYPRGLKGEEIPFAARLFAVVDVFDALTSDRPYRKAWSVERTLDHIREGAGTHFDPRVVEIFLELVREAPEGIPVLATS